MTPVERAALHASCPWRVRYDGRAWYVSGGDGWQLQCQTLGGCRHVYLAMRDEWVKTRATIPRVNDDNRKLNGNSLAF